MGRIKTKMIKRSTHDLLSKFPDKFSASFEENKITMKGLISVESKKIRNSIAGYITRIKHAAKQ